ncbi:MAG: hypothetical protein JST93_17555 [Acidobacteria bacterium]|nr:hypothetical protein [Acidobacteriota bacterium]
MPFVQDRYVGDIGDFGKYALLNALAGDDLRLGVHWCLNRAEEKNSDGRFVEYRHLRGCSPELFDRLQAIVREDARAVSSVEQRSVLPGGSIYFGEPAPVRRGKNYAAERAAWNQAALERLSSAEIVFFDPDNGICGNDDGRVAGPKHVHPGELKSYAERGQSLVVYQHQRRVKLEVMVAETLRELEMGCAGGWALVFRRVSVRVYYVVPSREHRATLWTRVKEFGMGPWGKHFRLMTSTGNSGVRLFQYLVDLANRGEAVGISYDTFLAYLDGALDFRSMTGRNYLPSDTGLVLDRAAEVTALAGRRTVRRGERSIEAGMDTFIWHKPKPHHRPVEAWANENHIVPYSREDWLGIFPDGERRLIGAEELAGLF